MTIRRNFFLILLLFATKASISQAIQPAFTIVKGTAEYTLGKIVSMAQDKHGYMWFADQNNACLVRYDGYRMKQFHNDPTDTNSVGATSFECIAADPDGNIWVGAPRGVDKYDDVNGRFIHYRYPAGENDRGDNSLLIDHTGIVWIGTQNGLDRLDPATGKFIHYVHSDKDPSSLSYNHVRSLYEDKAGVIWVGTGFPFDPRSNEGGLNRFDRKTSTFTRYLHDPANPASLISNKVRAIFEDSKGNFWVGTDGDGLHLMNRQKGTFERLTNDPAHAEKLSRPPVSEGNLWDHITFINEDIKGKLWIGTYSQGIVCYDPQSKKIDHFSIDDNKRPGGYTDSSTWGCYMSKDGNIWISNEVPELFRVDPCQNGFSKVKLDNRTVDFFEDSARNLWVASPGTGIIMTNQASNYTKVFSHNPYDSLSLSSNDLNFIKPSLDGQLWVGAWNGGNLFNTVTGKSKRFFYTPQTHGRDSTGLFSVLETKEDIYFGLNGGRLAVQNRKSGIITNYTNNPGDTTSISWGPPGSFGAIVDLVKVADGQIWVSVWNSEGASLDLFNPQTKKFKHYLRQLTVGTIRISKTGTMWVGTSKGLYYRDDSLDTFIPVGPEESEFRKSRIRSFVEDAYNNLWGINGTGIFRYNTQKKELCIYGDRFGVYDVSATSYQGTGITSGGELLFGNPNGYYKCFTNDVINRIPPQIVISDFKIDGHTILKTHDLLSGMAIEDAKEITLTHTQNIFSIEFAAIHFSDPENNTTEYMLEGYEHTWRQAKAENAAYYFNVQPGNYTLRLRASSSYGLWSEKTLLISVLPPWWRTWWFMVLEILFAIALIYAFIQYRSHNLKQRNIVLEKKVQQRTTELNKSLAELKTTQDQLIQSEKMASLGELTSGIAHEIKNPLNFISNFSEINLDLVSEIEEDQGDNVQDEAHDRTNTSLKTLRKNLEKIIHHGRRIDGIVKGMLQHSRTGNANKEAININTLCDESLRLAYHGFKAKEKTFNASFKTEFDPELPFIKVIPQDLGRVLLNLINNAFYTVNEKKKHNQSESPEEALQTELLYMPLVIVATKKSGDKIIITVSDNGMGVPPAIINKIFQPFFTTKPTGEGTGLGLSMSYDIITKSHGGELKVKSKEGVGADFEIILPIN